MIKETSDVVFPCLPDQVEPVVVGQPEVKQNEVVEVDGYLFRGIRSCIGQIAEKALLLQVRSYLNPRGSFRSSTIRTFMIQS